TFDPAARAVAIVGYLRFRRKCIEAPAPWWYRSIGGGLWRGHTMLRRVAVACALTLIVSAAASAQSGTTATSTAQSASATQTRSSGTTADETRPATTTFFGDTGLW